VLRKHELDDISGRASKETHHISASIYRVQLTYKTTFNNLHARKQRTILGKRSDLL